MSLRGFLVLVALLLLTAVDGWSFGKPPTDEKDHVRVDQYGDVLPDRAVARLGTTRFKHPGPLQAVAFSRDGKLVAASSSTPSLVRIWDRATGKLLDQWRFTDEPVPEQLCFSPDGQRLYAGRFGDRERFWSVWDINRHVGMDLGPTGERSVPFHNLSPDGRHAVFAVGDQITCWNLATDQKEATFDRPHRKVADCALTEGIGWIAITYDGKNYVATRLKDGKALWSMEGDWDGMLPNQPCAFTPDGRRVAVRTEAGHIQVIETASGNTLTTIHGLEDGAVNAMTFSPDGATLGISWKHKGVRLYGLQDGKERANISPECGNPLSLAFAPDSKSLVTADPDGPQALLFFNSTSGTRINSVAGHVTPISALAISSDGSTVATASLTGGDPLLAVWNVADSKCRWTSRAGKFGDVAFSPDGTKLATTFRAKRNPHQLWDVRTGKLVKESEWGGDISGSFAFCSNDRLVGGFDHRVQTWDIAVDKFTGPSMFLPHGIDRIVAGHNSQFAIVTTPQIYFCDLKSGSVKGPVTPINKTLSGFALSPDGRLLATADGGNLVRVWEVLTWYEAATIELPYPVAGITFAPTGHTIAAATSGGTILYSLATSSTVTTLQSGPTADTLVAFSANGKKLVTAGNRDSTAMVWDIANSIALPKAAAGKGTDIDCQSCWTDLMSSDPKVGYAAVWKLVSVPDRSIPFLAKQLGEPLADAKRIARLISDLDSAQFAVRDRAMRQLNELNEDAVQQLREARKGKASAEQVERIDVLLKAIDGPLPSPSRLRSSRAVAVLELLKGSDAREIIEKLAKGPASAVLMEEAKGAVERRK